MNYLLKNKFFIIFLAFIVITFGLITNISYGYYFTLDNYNAGLIQVEEYFRNNDLVLYNYVISERTIYALSTEDATFYVNGSGYVHGNSKVYCFAFNGETVDYTGVNRLDISWDMTYGSEIIYSTFDVLYQDGSVFFQKPPQTTINPMEIQGVEELNPMIAKIAETITPVCLGLLGILLVIYLIKSKNLLQV